MKPEEAESAVRYLFGAFNREPTVPQLTAWVTVVEPLDADVVMRVAMHMQRTLERLPSAAAFIVAVQAESQRGRPGGLRRWTPKCEICLDDGQVFVDLDGREIAAACPGCARGLSRPDAGFWTGRSWEPAGRHTVKVTTTEEGT